MLYLLRIAVSVALVAYLAYSAQAWRALRPLSPHGWAYVVLIAVLVNLDRIVMAYKWGILLKAVGVDLSFGDAVRHYYIGTFWGMFLPASVGGDVIRTYRVSAQTRMGGEAASSVILERVLGLLATLIMAIACTAALAVLLPDLALQFARILGIALLAFTALFLLSFHR
jgi:uncharacterized protein (TIRG00374 family)